MRGRTAGPVRVTVEEHELAPGIWADVVCEVMPDEPAVTWGPPDNWHPGSPGYAEPIEARIVVDEDAAAILGCAAERWVDGQEMGVILRGHEEAIEDRARELASNL